MNGKDVVYIDADEEITGIIDKVRSSGKQLVALVLPKRAAMLQSSVNMKLLKKTADSAKKHVVLVTTESSLMPLAGSVGLYVAKNLDSKPAIPAIEGEASQLDDLAVDDDVPSEDFSAEDAAEKPVGALAGLEEIPDEPAEAEPAKKVKPELTPRPIPRATAKDDDETIELDNSVPESDLAAAAAETDKGEKAKKSKNKKLKVPNFEKFRLRLVLAVALVIILIVGFILANIILPKADVTIYTKTSGVDTNLTLSLSTTADKLDPSGDVVPAYLQQDKKSQSAQVATTGQKNEGQTASGSITMSIPCSAVNGQPPTIPAGTAVSANSLTYITQSSVSITSPNFGNGCTFTGSTNITAQQGGSQYNQGNGTPFTVSGYSNVSASGSASGGTDNIVQVVSQADIQSAESKLSSVNGSGEKSSLSAALKKAGYYALPSTYNAGTPSTSSSAQVGDQASNVTVTETTVYSMFGVHQSDLNSLIQQNVDSQINTSEQAIIDNGLSSADFSVVSQSGKGAQLSMQVTSNVGPNINQANLKKQIAGKKSGDVRTTIQQLPGVKSVNVHLSPFWVGAVPKNVNKITVTVKKS